MSSRASYRFAYTFSSIGRDAAGRLALALAAGARPKMDGRAENHRERYRTSEGVWIEPDDGVHWLCHKPAVLFSEVNGQ